MANQNLSQFGEKLFVADADHTFIWDSEASISKRVSRNSWLNSGTLTSDAPVTISQTWGNNLVAFTALKVNAAGTSDANSATASNFLELQVNGATRFKIDKLAHFYIANPNSRFDININNVPVAAFFAGGLMRTYGSLGFSDPTTFPNDLILTRDGAGQLALRNGAAAQTFNVYGTSSASNANYARLALTCGLDGNATISTQALGTGTAGELAFSPSNTERMRITTAGNVGIGTTSPTSKLQVSSGDVEVDTIAKGVILKSPDGTRYRVTVANGGTLSVAAV